MAYFCRIVRNCPLQVWYRCEQESFLQAATVTKPRATFLLYLTIEPFGGAVYASCFECDMTMNNGWIGLTILRSKAPNTFFSLSPPLTLTYLTFY